jgi:hypothetical protein
MVHIVTTALRNNCRLRIILYTAVIIQSFALYLIQFSVFLSFDFAEIRSLLFRS